MAKEEVRKWIFFSGVELSSFFILEQWVVEEDGGVLELDSGRG